MIERIKLSKLSCSGYWLFIDEQGAAYYRYRDTTNQKLLTKKLGTFAPHTFRVMIDAVKKLKASNELGINLLTDQMQGNKKNVITITLNEFLYGTFLEKKIEENPKTAVKKVKVVTRNFAKLLNLTIIENFRFYDLRHDFASKILMRTGNIYLVSHLLNHRQIETTKHYAHLMDKSKLAAVQTLDTSRQKGALPDFLKDGT